MHHYIKVVASFFALNLVASLCAAQRVTLDDLAKTVVSVSLDGADIRAVQEELNRNVSELIFNLETDQRDAAQLTLHVEDVPLTKLLDDVCRTLGYAWSLDSANRSINLFPANTKRYGYYPFGLTIPPIEMHGADMYDVLISLQNSSLLGEKYSFLISFGESEETRKRWKRFEGTLENMSLRQAFNWICANSGRPICWRSGFLPPDVPTFGFGSKFIAKNPDGASAK